MISPPFRGHAPRSLRRSALFIAWNGARAWAPKPSAKAAPSPDDPLVMEVEGDGFLRHMVRNIAGTLVEIGLGRYAPGQIDRILASRDRAQAGVTAPPQGLFLKRVLY